jgi:peptidoglycan/xylan/chitin deacetylase (PgdA/CDA1 family)
MRVILSIDVEAHRTLREISEGEDSLGKILEALGRYRVRATFFVDVCEVKTWGYKYIQSVCDRIKDGGHELALHVHPHHYTRDSKRWLLSEYSLGEQRKVIRYAVEEFRKLAGAAPSIFRAGGFGIDASTLSILSDENLHYDSSFLRGRHGCLIQVPHSGHREYFTLGAIEEIPPTPVVTLSMFGKLVRSEALDFNWMPLFFIKRVFRFMRVEGAKLAVLLMHSSSMMRRVSKTDFEFRSENFRKFCKLLEYVNKHDHFVTFSDCEQISATDSVSRGLIYHEKNVLVQYSLLLYQSYVGRGHNRKFFIFWWFHVTSAMVIFCALLILAIFAGLT